LNADLCGLGGFRRLEKQFMSKSKSSVKFKTTLVTSNGKPIYHYLLVEKEWVAPLGFTGSARRVVCTMNGVETIQCPLMGNGMGGYYISLNKDMRTRLCISVGDKVDVELTRDESKYGSPMPKELREVLRQDPDGDRMFQTLTPGKQRILLYLVGNPSDIDKRIQVAWTIVEYLKNHDGKYDYTELHEYISRSVFKREED